MGRNPTLMEFTFQTNEGDAVRIEPVDPRQPVVDVKERFVADGCSCVVWLGHRVDNGELTVVSTPCGDETHARLFRRFTDLMRWSASGDPSSRTRRLSDVCEDLLTEAATEMGGNR